MLLIQLTLISSLILIKYQVIIGESGLVDIFSMLTQMLLTRLTRVSSLVAQRASLSFQPLSTIPLTILIHHHHHCRLRQDDNGNDDDEELKEGFSKCESRVSAALSADQWRRRRWNEKYDERSPRLRYIAIQYEPQWKMWREVTDSNPPLWPLSQPLFAQLGCFGLNRKS